MCVFNEGSWNVAEENEDVIRCGLCPSDDEKVDGDWFDWNRDVLRVDMGEEIERI